MILAHFIFYTLGIFTVLECVLGGIRQFEDKWNMHVVYEIFSFTLLMITVAWCVVGLVIGDFIMQFIVILTLELAFPLYKAYYNYDENTLVFLMRKVITLVIAIWIMSESIFTYYFC